MNKAANGAPATAVWFCGPGQAPVLETLLQEPGTAFALPVVALALDHDVVEPLQRIQEKHPSRFEAVPAYSPELRAAALRKAVHERDGHLQIMLDIFRYHPSSFPLLTERAGAGAGVLTFDYLVRRNSCFWTRGQSFLRRQGVDIALPPPDIEAMWIPATLLRKHIDALTGVRADRAAMREFGAGILGGAAAVASSAMLAGHIELAPRDDTLAINETAQGPAGLPGPMTGVDLAVALARRVRACVAGAVGVPAMEALWRGAGDRLRDDRAATDVLALLLADALGIACIANGEASLPETAATVREGVVLEAVLMAPGLADALVPPVLRGDGAFLRDDPVAAARRIKALREDVIRWQMEYANTRQTLAGERIKIRRLNKRAAHLAARLKVAQGREE